jgi:acetyl-CoA acetyltransferase
MDAVITAARAIKAGEAKLVIAAESSLCARTLRDSEG